MWVFNAKNAVLTPGSASDILLYHGLQWERYSYLHLFPSWLNLHWVAILGSILTAHSLSASLQGRGCEFEKRNLACAYLGAPNQVNGTSNTGGSVCKSIIAVDLGHSLQTALSDGEAIIFYHHLSHFYI